MKAVIITSIVGGYDTLKPIPTDLPCCVVSDTMPQCEAGADKQWKFVEVVWSVDGNERRSRMPKCMPYQFVDAEASIWVDGSLRFDRDPEELLRHLESGDMALYRHPQRDCAYEEAPVLIERGRGGEPEIIRQQMETYKRAGFPEHHGMAECTVIVRRHTPEVERFGDAWWAEQTRWSSWDQLSFDYIRWKTGITYAAIPGNVRKGLCRKGKHLT